MLGVHIRVQRILARPQELLKALPRAAPGSQRSCTEKNLYRGGIFNLQGALQGAHLGKVTRERRHGALAPVGAGPQLI